MKKVEENRNDSTSIVSDNAYQELLAECAEIILHVEKNIIQSYWSLGALGNKLRGEERAKYGNKTVENLADDLRMSRSKLYSALQFNAIFTLDELSNALDKGLTMRHVIQLLPLKDEQKRIQLAEKVGRDGLTSDQLRAEVKKTKPKVKGKRGRKKQFTFDTFYKRIIKLDDWLTDEFLDAFEAGGKAAKKTELKNLEALHGRIGAILQRMK